MPERSQSNMWPDSASTTRSRIWGKRSRTRFTKGTVRLGPGEVGMPTTAGPAGTTFDPAHLVGQGLHAVHQGVGVAAQVLAAFGGDHAACRAMQ